MKKFTKKVLAVFLTLALAVSTVSVGTITETANVEAATADRIENLQVCYETNPVGLDDTPNFSWKMNSATQGQKQTAYQIKVAKDKTMKTIVWDSKKVAKDTSLEIKYAGQDLLASTRYYWNVTVWDKDGKAITSDTAYFETGLMDETAWNDATWISAPDVTTSTAKGQDQYTLEADLQIVNDNAGIVFSGTNSDNFFMWQFNTRDHGSNLYLRKHYFVNPKWDVQEVDIESKCSSSKIKSGEVHLKIVVDKTNIKTYMDDVLVDESTRSDVYLGKVGVRVSHVNPADERCKIDNLKLTNDKDNKVIYNYDFETENPFDKAETEGGKLVVMTGDGTELLDMLGDGIGDGIDMFCKDFKTASNKTLQSAKIYSSALGIYELYCNGERVGKVEEDGTVTYDEFKPGYTDYRYRVLYYTYDITSMLKDKADNAIAAKVASGWWNGRMQKMPNDVGANQKNAFIGILKLTYTDGTTEMISTDTTWKHTKNTSVRSADIWDGEGYDARIDDSVYSKPGEAIKALEAATEFSYSGKITASNASSVKVFKDLERTPVSTVVYEGAKSDISTYGTINVVKENATYPLQIKKGQTAVIDIGQNMVGRPNFTLNAAKGTKVTIRVGEMLNDSGRRERGNDGPRGSVYKENYRGAAATNTYIASGAGDESYHALYTYYGYRYLEVTANRDITIKRISSDVMGSDTALTGSINTSNPQVNQLASNALWGQLGNYYSTATDCPQRAERFGWTGDAQCFVGTATYNADVRSFYGKWMQDLRDGQRGDGTYENLVPYSRWCGEAAPGSGWADAGIIIPYTVYRDYNDKSLIEEYYDSMKAYISRLERTGGAENAYSDWLAYNWTDGPMMVKAYYAYDVMLMEEMAKAIGKTEDANYYHGLYEQIRSDYVSKYFENDDLKSQEGYFNHPAQGHPTNTKTQTGYLLTYRFGLYENETQKQNLIRGMNTLLEDNDYKLSTGFIGTANLMNTLGEMGNSEMAYNLLMQRENPSWLYCVDQGATTVWERWNSYTAEDGFGPVDMNSFNHYAYGAVAEWMYKYMAGIQADKDNPGFKHIILAPQPDTRADADIPMTTISHFDSESRKATTTKVKEEKITHATANYNSAYGNISSSWSTENGIVEYKATIPANTTATVNVPMLENKCNYIRINGKKIALSETKKGKELADGVTYNGRVSDTTVSFEVVSGTYSFKEAGKNEKAITSFTLDKTKLTLAKGAKATLKAIIAPAVAADREVTFSSNNTAVATVDASGVVTAVGNGTAIITAKADAKTATCEVVVGATATPAKPDTFTGIKGGKYYKNGKLVKKLSVITYKNKKYVVKKTGKIAKKEIVKVSGKSYYAGKDGVLVKNKIVKVGKYKYYFNKKYVMVKNKKFKYAKKTYKADKKGHVKVSK
ncbi:MAG: family 78 glycoside hydrolase catalytic domain [Lachnospiraceae bacterium]|nr:family 78 glycoside hydrolase catalytic domain [Lachnospiraceae bacterium]